MSVQGGCLRVPAFNPFGPVQASGPAQAQLLLNRPLDIRHESSYLHSRVSGYSPMAGCPWQQLALFFWRSDVRSPAIECVQGHSFSRILNPLKRRLSPPFPAVCFFKKTC